MCSILGKHLLLFFDFVTLQNDDIYLYQVNIMKESLRSGFSFVQTLINSCMDECKTPRINSTVRRGYPPLKNDHHDESFEHRFMTLTGQRIMLKKDSSHQEQLRGVYPWTAFGTVISKSQTVGKYLGLAIIIGDDYILASRSNQIYQKSSQIYFIPSFPQKQEEKYKIESIFPAYPPPLSTEPNDDVCILIVNKRSRLESNYGSLGINFRSEDRKVNTNLVIVGFDTVSRTLRLLKGKIQVKESTFSYHLNYKYESLSESFLLQMQYGELFLIGISFKTDQKLITGFKFTKQLFYKLKKCTFKGYQIDLSQHPLREKQLEYLKEMSMRKVVTLDFEATNLNQRVLDVIGRDFPLLQILILDNNDVDDNCLEFISAAQLKQLNHFSGQRNRFTSQGMRHVSKSCWNNLKKLQLSDNPIGSKGLLYLSKTKWTLLQSLILNHTRIDNYGCEKLRKAQFPTLKQLSLKKNKIREEGLRWILQGNWPELKYFIIGRNQLMEDGLKQLIKGSWPNLKVLHYESNRVHSKFGIKTKLRACFKKTNLS